MRFEVLFLLALTGLAACKQRDAHHAQKDEHLLALGDSITKAAFLELSTALTTAISEKGVPHALEYCNTNALTITKQVSLRYKVSISRVAERYRNPANAANEMEQALMKEYRQQMLAGNSPSHQLIHTSEGKTIYYKPILLQPFCITCHGTEEQIGAENLKVIKDIYPGDLATGFKEGDLRGLWKIVF